MNWASSLKIIETWARKPVGADEFRGLPFVAPTHLAVCSLIKAKHSFAV